MMWYDDCFFYRKSEQFDLFLLGFCSSRDYNLYDEAEESPFCTSQLFLFIFLRADREGMAHSVLAHLCRVGLNTMRDHSTLPQALNSTPLARCLILWLGIQLIIKGWDKNRRHTKRVGMKTERGRVKVDRINQERIHGNGK